MDRFAVLVDAGYLLRQSTGMVSKKASFKREALDLVNPHVVFFCVLVISILALYLYGVPTTMEIEEKKWTIFADACVYFFPCLAALIGGWGIFLGTGAKTERPRERS